MFRAEHLLATIREHSCVQVDIFEIKTFVRPLSLLRKEAIVTIVDVLVQLCGQNFQANIITICHISNVVLQA